MRPPLALLLYTAFVPFLFQVERLASLRVSAASGIPTFWMLAIDGIPVAVCFGTHRGHGRVLVAMCRTRSVAAC
jgi:hypothetical protein